MLARVMMILFAATVASAFSPGSIPAPWPRASPKSITSGLPLVSNAVPSLCSMPLFSSESLAPRRQGLLGSSFSKRTRSRICRLRASTSGSEEKGYQVVDKKTEAMVVYPINDSIKAKDIECKITKSSALLSVKGDRIIDGVMWGTAKTDESYWEIDEYGKEPRCVILRVTKEISEDWLFFLKTDYQPASDFAGRKVISRESPTPEDVEQALQFLVTIMGGPKAAPESKESDDKMKQDWDKAVQDTVTEEWTQAGKEMREKLREQGSSPSELKEIIEVTEEALKGATPPEAPFQGLVPSITFVRHSTTDKAQGDSVEDDLGRVLTVDGRSLAASSRRWFSTLCKADDKPFGVAVSSKAGRCLETAFLMGAPEPIVLSGVYDGIMTEECRAAFAAEGYATLEKYISSGHGAILRTYAERGLVELADALEYKVTQLRDDPLANDGNAFLGNVVVFGHAVFSAAMAMLLAQALRLHRSDTTLIAKCLHGEAEGIVVCGAGTGHCNLDSTKLDEGVDMQTAQSLSYVYKCLKSSGYF